MEIIKEMTINIIVKNKEGQQNWIGKLQHIFNNGIRLSHLGKTRLSTNPHQRFYEWERIISINNESVKKFKSDIKKIKEN
jgi:hypothetical protein